VTPFGDAAANGDTAAVSDMAAVGDVAPFDVTYEMHAFHARNIFLRYVWRGKRGEARRVCTGPRLATSVHVSHSLASRLAGGPARLASCLACEAKVRLVAISG